MARNGDWATVGYVKSKSSSRSYKIQRNEDSGALSCSCPSWRYRHDDLDHRSCKHTLEFERRSA